METLVNFRGLNDFTTVNNRKMQANMIFRSGELVNIAAQERAMLFEKFNIKQIYDFRSSKEVTEKPDDDFTGVAYHHIDLMRDAGGHTASLEVFASNFDGQKADDVMKDMYQDIVLSASGREGLHNFMNSLVTSEGPAIFHCFAGKDRTGVAAALLLASLQVTPDQIMRDYLATNPARKIANDAILANYRANGLDEKALAVIETMLYVKQDYLEHSFATIEDNFGSIAHYFKANDGLGLSSDVITALRHQYLV
ncbi:tyrosine-protein phosphatase [Periweissella fabalis]|uniref:Tyrosine-protein phosphatase n=1 Tax=Periweissella fabalis TaxID=1070421 RepID=A0A7X6N242_9LACO|nr:tyrosine-protein phosphatase [Periweissella fabalis]MCM0599582.1 tyrosine-protein phosphatase [Periweissella fabalis]NKZ23887.1 tyrosine-protein phosphatase [Periweissella fabalis]